jgi:hypothetical protein
MRLTKLIHVIAILTLLDCSCSKKNNPTPVSPANNYKITLVSGNNQTAAIGYPLNDSIVVKVTLNGAPASNYDVQFIGSGCNEDLITDLHTKADGTVKYLWLMASNQGLQTLKAVAKNGNQRVDSVNVNATAISNSGMAVRSACTPNPGGVPERILQLSTGRLIACFYTQTSIRYSDDNGLSWYPIKSFGASHTVLWIATTPQDEIFAATLDDGVFYSKDAGNTWNDISPSNFSKQGIVGDIAYTAGGKLILAGPSNNIYTSTDKGKTWLMGTGLADNASYVNPVELNNGDLYIINMRNIMYKSSDAGKTWIAQNTTPNEYITSIYVDNNGWFYKASSKITSEAILISKDNGVTFSNIVTFDKPTNQPYINNISVQPDGYLYFGELSYSIARVYNNNFVAETYALSDSGFAVYIVTKNNILLYANKGGIY